VRIIIPTIAAVTTLVGCPTPPSVPTAEAAPGAMMAISMPSASAVRGVGWYPNVEVDSNDRIHVAFVDADAGDVHYRVTEPSGIELGPDVVVESKGAVGHYLRMAVAPGGAPVLSYGHQDDKSLHLAHRPADVAAMSAAGAVVDPSPLPTLPSRIVENRPAQADNGFVIEELVFADDAGRGSSLAIGTDGRPHVLYYTNEMIRLARRPADVPAFGPAALGHWEKFDVDRARASPRTQTDLKLAGGVAWMSYCDDAITDGRLRVARLDAGTTSVTVLPVVDAGKSIDHQGSISTVLATEPLAVASWQAADARVDVLVDGPKGLSGVPLLRGAVGPAVARRSSTSDFVLYRTDGDDAGLYLMQSPRNDPTLAKRTRLGRVRQGDGWLDLAIRSDGRPVAVWFDGTTKSAWMYAP
jgi:hypothetical protein